MSTMRVCDFLGMVDKSDDEDEDDDEEDDDDNAVEEIDQVAIPEFDVYQSGLAVPHDNS